MGPFWPKVLVYGVTLDLLVEIGGDISTTPSAAHVAANVRVSAGTQKLNNDVLAIAAKVLPLKMKAGSCEFDVVALGKTGLTIAGNTASIQATISVKATSCPLKGDVSVAAQVVPTATNAGITLKIVQLEVRVPVLWRLAGSISGKDPSALIEAAIRKRMEAWILPFPKVEHVQGAFQSVSLAESGDVVTVSVRSDASIDRQAIMNALNGSDWFKRLEIKVP